MNIQAKRFGWVTLFFLVLAIGCRHDDLPRQVVHGDVVCDGTKIDRGTLRFAPLEATSPLPSTTGFIRDGQYRIEFRGGVPLGKYRVEIYAERLTGKMVLTVGAKKLKRLFPSGREFTPAGSRR